MRQNSPSEVFEFMEREVSLTANVVDLNAEIFE
jgi:hypothetical protein